MFIRESIATHSWIFLVSAVISTPVQLSCPYGQYYEAASRTCKSCEQLCMQSPGSEDYRCEWYCAGFDHQRLPDQNSDQHATETKELCPLGMYEDEDMARCKPCKDICDDAEQKDTEAQCKHMCPEYKMRKEDMGVLNSHKWLMFLWTLAACILVILIAMIIFMVFKFSPVCRDRRREIRVFRIPSFFHPSKKSPYGKLPECNPQKRVDQWLSLLHTKDGDTCQGVRTSLIFHPAGKDPSEVSEPAVHRSEEASTETIG